MFGRPKYTYYSYKADNNYRGSKKKKYKVEKRNISGYDEIKEDIYKLSCDAKKIFAKKKCSGTKFKVQNKHNDGHAMKIVCIGLISFILMSAVITFPAALLVCLMGALLYPYK
ncbi:hypothetical protein [uncultured Clostridium sp.]|jgi:hypothetical protein|uniref:hypothetical protein n=1 Tax=uncultured Clostridium sp. TaxID=59620 RepID=UPI002611A9AA|nr:hypothetical protein [uncultured Clostridium sp.]